MNNSRRRDDIQVRYPIGRFLLTLLIAGVGSAASARAADAPAGHDWPQWRGPHFDGTGDAIHLPEKFSKEENLLWSVKLPGPSNGTPIISGDRIFTTAIDSNRKMLALALDRATGKIVWQEEVGLGLIHPKGENDVVSPSPTTDGKIVVFMYGTGDIVGFDRDGKRLWARNLQKDIGEFNINWIYGSSPTLYNGRLYVQVLHTDTPYKNTEYPDAKKFDGDPPSYMLALDPTTGKELFRQVRPTNAVKETKESYATPIPYTGPSGKEEILLVGGDAVTAHDPATGAEIWRFSGWDPGREPYWRLIPSVVAGDGYVFACAPKSGPVMAIRDGGSGDVSATNKAWFSNGKQMTSDVAVPLFYKGKLYVLGTNNKKLQRVEPKSGEIEWTAELGGTDVFRGSPTGADGKIFCINRSGDIWVVSPEDGKVLSKTSLGAKGAYGSIAAADGILAVRVADTLYAFGPK